ncbi:RNA exonuclease 1 homolog isoform X1 [Vombatus ursinus]|uniref:RNA exonuclease 1 homolog isoform X1 n=1 Tax=Vombatus ursinus TaxID=29139 RepID=UPI000FFD14C5|nr:RNA exonuclease 1 homolog isoform X1 [Vombatus ursinus]
MLRSTGFFRAIDCPYWAGAGAGASCCRRPYCHFRHRGSERGPARGEASTAAANGPGPGGGGAARSAGELGYDPYNPDLPKPSVGTEHGSLGDVPEPSSGILELELVNQAIEAVRNEVEQEEKKYKELLETTKEYGATETSLVSQSPTGAGVPNPDSFATSLEYNPGSYNLLNNNTDYNPTPLAAANKCNKYTLDSLEKSKAKGNSLEYVPKSVIQPKKYSRAVPNSKYVIDNSKPSTDLEYDPLSNYSARLLNKGSPKDQKGVKRRRDSNQDESYTPSLKKHCDVFSNYETDARFSDSEDEDPGSENQPSPASPTKARTNSESQSSGGSSPGKGKPLESEESSSRETKEIAVQYDMGDIQRRQSPIGKPPPEKSGKGNKHSSEGREKVAEGDLKCKGSLKDHRVQKRKSHDQKSSGHQEVENQREKSKSSEKDKGKNKDKAKGKLGEKNHREKKLTKVKSDGHISKMEKSKLEKQEVARKEKFSSAMLVASSGKRKNDGLSKRPSMGKLGSHKKESKVKPADPPNGKNISSSNKLKDKKGSKSFSSGKLKDKKSLSLDEGTSQGSPKPKKRTLSHIDLFGDESGDEGEGTSPVLPATLPSLSSDSDSDDGSCSLPNESKGPKRLRGAQIATSSSSSSEASDDIDYSVLEKELDYDSDPMEECLRIFNESTDVKTEDKGRLNKQPSKEEKIEGKSEDSLTTLFPGQKRRISHLSKQGNVEVPSKPVIRPYRPPTAQEACYRRTQLAQRQASDILAVRLAAQKHSVSLPEEKKRIAHVPNPRMATALAAAANSAPTGAKKSNSLNTVQVANGSEPNISLKSRTMSGMASKTSTTSVQKRIAHVPSLQSVSLNRPVIPTEFGAKVPTNIRQRYLNLFIDECLKFCPSPQEAYDKALSEEKVAYERSSSKNIYLNVAVNTLKKLRSLGPGSVQCVNILPAGCDSPSGESTRSGCSSCPPAENSNRKVVSHEAVLGGKLATKTSFTLNRSGSLRAEDLTGAALYRRLKEYILTEDQLKENGYPLPHPEKPGRAVVFTTEEKKTTDSSCRICCRCGTEYLVSPTGNCIRKEECCHHWGRLRRQRVAGGWETQYSCCSGAVGSVGCQVAKQHVQDGRKDNLEGFVKTFEKLPSSDGYPGIYALDCEMCYTKQGLELTRITVINSDLKVVYDTFVKPDNKVVDYNTRFSGVTEEDLQNACITLRDVQAVLLNMFSSDTILIGHSLESDLFALKLIHTTVVDTSVVFPHRLGLPYKRALRTLMADYLKRIIQDNVEGHDSSEDASSCMELMIWKIKEDSKVKR